jgi:hypothetical protein
MQGTCCDLLLLLLLLLIVCNLAPHRADFTVARSGSNALLSMHHDELNSCRKCILLLRVEPQCMQLACFATRMHV